MKYKIEVGQVFSRLTVMSEGDPYIHNKIVLRRYLCLCECGNKVLVQKARLFNGTTKSCGCYRKEIHPPGFKTLYPKLYSKYKSARSRCNNPNNSQYKHYGARGIKFLFNQGFVDFAKYCLEIGWQPELEMDRIDNNGNYEKGNIRFVPHILNVRNRRKSSILEVFGEKKHIKEWELDSRCMVKSNVIYARLQNGWSSEQAITLPSHTHHKFHS